jgi:NADH-quinone oxidoreductase subunit L
LRRLQTGFVRSYALSMLAGAFAVIAVLLAVRFS